MAKLTFYYDVVSPYSWFGFAVVNRYREIWKNVAIDLQPMYLGGVMKASGNKPPATNPAKGQYMASDLPRNRLLYGLSKDIIFPTNFPSNSINVQRLLTVLKLERPEYLVPASVALWEGYWGNDLDFTPENVVKVLQPVLKDDTLSLLQKCSDPTIKEELTNTTEKAIAAGAFGAPWIVCERDSDNGVETSVFFGSDRFEAIAMWLNQPYYGVRPNVSKVSKL
ncbi:glutathione S-transferase kappa 1-like protein [Globomyces pollinis-pini]|nr:glutathione S-transferase kappa 1-like protein [Globomyces pollinis-pini]